MGPSYWSLLHYHEGMNVGVLYRQEYYKYCSIGVVRSCVRPLILFHSSSKNEMEFFLQEIQLFLFFPEEKAMAQRDQGDLVGLWIGKHGLMVLAWHEAPFSSHRGLQLGRLLVLE